MKRFDEQQENGKSAAKMPKHDMSGYAIPTGAPQQIAMLVYPQMTALDLVGPLQFLSALGNVQVHLVWKDRKPITTDSGLVLTPTSTFAECPHHLTVLFAPGGTQGTINCIEDDSVLAFFRQQGKSARYVTSVCTGSLILGAAGLLRGYRATSHWQTRDLLREFGAIPTAHRVVEDRNRITGAGVTSGIDFALHLTERLRNEKYARALTLGMEYDPQPPFRAGRPETAGTDVTEMMNAMFAPAHERFKSAAEKAKRML